MLHHAAAYDATSVFFIVGSDKDVMAISSELSTAGMV
jgi:hypothetical protein